ncbi:E3 ubiquitin-protein ligase RAD18-like isoform X3 [Myxocyprinus asiaticus]|uniref:E3 ubiquitin-protein ligase RAD18-like isoform X3 n=1 Tax=Myxocyprinus asiaticus TaxID=70543 RepID=UPI0022222DE7|nr:E3 ubiquitin-protein ligase RAD18-like isoform X3 [Myxocyprinus asiaticus]
MKWTCRRTCHVSNMLTGCIKISSLCRKTQDFVVPTVCSLCIRKFLSYKLVCPVCNLPSTEQDLRNNRLIDDLVQSFQNARQQLCQSNFESPPISPQTPAMMFKGKAARQKGLKKEATTLSQFFQKRASATTLSGAQTSLQHHLPVKEEPMEVHVQQPHSLKQESVEDTTGMVKEEKMNVPVFPSTSQSIKAGIKVECPVCGVGVSEQHINKHLDMCLNRDDKKEGLRSGRRRKAMPKLLYTLISVPKLKKMLKECHMSTQGNRDQLIRRHQEFTQIYNAQCDALNPKSAEEIAKEVENNERMRNQLDSKRKPAIVTTKNQTADEIEELHSEYSSFSQNVLCSTRDAGNASSSQKAISTVISSIEKGKQHCSEFSRLIAQVRGRLETSKRTQIKQEEGQSTEETDSKVAHNSFNKTTQPSFSTILKVKSEEKDVVIELPSRSPSPTISDVSVSSFSISAVPAWRMASYCVPCVFHQSRPVL